MAKTSQLPPHPKVEILTIRVELDLEPLRELAGTLQRLQNTWSWLQGVREHRQREIDNGCARTSGGSADVGPRPLPAAA